MGWVCFFFNDTATTEIYTLSLHDALPICDGRASLYNTFQQTFYYDVARPQGEIIFPAENGTVGGQSYGAVVRADASVIGVWFFIDDGAGSNDDDATGAENGNGVGRSEERRVGKECRSRWWPAH